jgi:alpha-D-ribose 1-methylphosphonate 5-phosphate C-P lyase
MTTHDGDYNFAYLDEQTKRMIRRAILKGVAVPGYQVPFASREMPMPYGWGTGRRAGLRRLPDAGGYAQGDRPGRRRHDQRGLDPQVLRKDRRRGGDRGDAEATIIQTRHRIPETPLTEDQILVYQVPIPEPLRFLEPLERSRPARCTRSRNTG